MLYHVLGTGGHPDAPLAPARLATVSIDGGTLQVSAARHGDGHVLNLNQILQLNLTGIFNDLGPALVAKVLLDLLELFDNHPAKNLLRTEDLKVFFNFLLNLR